ncbi:MAG: NAD-binding protein [Candidatus Eremiobacteraeota bacterium]|nr:NAD-binding protein [Candidatus Eremiobacteraeota bacterium]MBV8285279.1 NAD-binding protein [Candidatus Eremiobacteraeota bacterium]MBV8434331.1 NAD-binding protein [Candidatus Eremiobacteraeota bacterium]MBV8655988.1 NAD-binding protein [Candidatus Eremiobacteraeota bacterium]
MTSETLIIVVGGDYLALEICKEILKTAGHAVVLMWKHTDERSARLMRHEIDLLDTEFGHDFTFVNDDPTEPGALRRAGLEPPAQERHRSYCVVAVSQDDRLNLRVALLARDVNEHVRVTLRQFNPLLGHKIQEGLRYNCTAISPAAHAAATYAASAVDPSCFYALPFPTLESMVARVAHRREEGIDAGTVSEEDSELFGFCDRRAEDFGVAGMTVVQAEEQLKSRIVSIGGQAPYACHGDEAHTDEALAGSPLQHDDRIVVFGQIGSLKKIGPQTRERRAIRRERLQGQWRDVVAGVRRIEPVLGSAIVFSIVFYVAAVIFFVIDQRWDVSATMYFVLATMTTVGYGDVSPCKGCEHGPLSIGQAVPLFAAMGLMLVGVTFVAIFTASLTAALNAAATRRIRGLRRIHRSGHVIVCGAGNVGSLVIDYLRQLGEQVVVVEKNPDNLLIELARDRKIDLLTGDATNDETVTFCAPERAKSLVGVTNSDTANLETALGARSRVRSSADGVLHIVLRIDDLAFGRSIKRHFGISSFSTTELTAPTIAGLARFESTRGRFEIFGGTEYAQAFQLAERFQGADNAPPPAPPERPGYKVRWIPLFAWRETGAGKGVAVPIHKFAGEVHSGDRLLFMVPLDQFSD